MTYERVHYHSTNPNSPYLLYSELDDERWEVRKIEVYRDGTVAYADADHEVGVWLADQTMPTVEETNANPEFEAAEISRETFEAAWDRWVRRGCLRASAMPSTS